jgi:putative solute:sodium symporter small subunit
MCTRNNPQGLRGCTAASSFFGRSRDRWVDWEANEMAELTHEQREAYWKYNVRLTTILLIIWFVVGYILGGVLAGPLNKIVILGFPLGYYIAAQGSLAIFVIEIAVYARLMNQKDLEYGIREEG